MLHRVLVVEDDEALGPLLEYNLDKEGFQTTLVSNGDEALLRLTEETPDLIILDWMLPGTSGIEICRQSRARLNTRATPIIMLTAKGEEGDRIRGLEMGADDYVTKPFSISELIARVKAVLRRTAPQGEDDTLRFGDIVLDYETRRVRRAELEVKLGPTEFRLLECLMRRPGRVYSRAQLLDLVWGRDVFVDERTVDVHVGRLRKALNKDAGKDPIRTVRASGYALDETYPP